MAALKLRRIEIVIGSARSLPEILGAVRVHGGGFAGTVQAFVPVELADDYIAEMNRVFGEDACLKMRIRPVGGVEITKE